MKNGAWPLTSAATSLLSGGKQQPRLRLPRASRHPAPTTGCCPAWPCSPSARPRLPGGRRPRPCGQRHAASTAGRRLSAAGILPLFVKNPASQNAGKRVSVRSRKHIFLIKITGAGHPILCRFLILVFLLFIIFPFFIFTLLVFLYFIN